jgi:hypothetical protein
MNIFWLDEDPEKAARYHCDKHVTKMLVEYGQILSTAAWKCDFHDPERMYEPIPGLNPKVHDWASESLANFIRLYDLAIALHDEYIHRYGGTHGTYDKVLSKLDITEARIPNDGPTDPPLCMPDTYKVDGDTVASYRNFYIHGKDWSLSWFKRDVPDWYKDAGDYRDLEQ